ncbi:MAG: ABC transporter permease subunit [Dehalococcoidia bacterium]|jgi:ABC-2 type transport system permease protein|nr:MAG: ABC-2 type transport system permease protein [Chloroflexota bacterium]
MINKNSIFFNNINSRKKSLLYWCLALSALTIFIIYMYDSVGQEASKLLESTESDGIKAFIGPDAQGGTPAGWLGFELYGIFLPICLAIITIGYGAGAIGSEEESGTLELLLASPISRSKILTEKVLALLIIATIIPSINFVAVCLGSLLFNFKIAIFDVFLCSISLILFGIFFGCFALMMQTITKKRSLGISLTAAYVGGAYFMYTLYSLLDWLEPMKFFSPFYYYDGNKILQGAADPFHFTIMLVGIIFTCSITYISFSKRDTGI